MSHAFISRIGLVIALASAQTASAITYLTQDRSVSAGVSHGGGSVTEAAPDFADWDHSVSAGPAQAPFSGGSAAAHQVSSMSQTGVVISSTLSASKPAAAGTGSASSNSTLNVTFNITTPVEYHLTGTLRPGPNNGPSFSSAPRQVSLIGPGTNVDFNGNWSGGQEPTLIGNGVFDTAGILAAGTYTFFVTATSSDGGPQAQPIPSFNVNLAITPEPITAVPAALLSGIGVRRRVR